VSIPSCTSGGYRPYQGRQLSPILSAAPGDRLGRSGVIVFQVALQNGYLSCKWSR